MCGISGIFYKQPGKNNITADTMASVMCHRGPNHTGHYANKYISLAHNRLSILDLSENGNQPMTSACDKYVIVFNGQIYNFRELAEKYNFQLKSRTDTEVILQLFILKGDDFVYELNGMFAIGIYDVEKNMLHLYRDHLGIKPLFYLDNADFFIFGSELKSIINLPSIASKLTLDYNALTQYLHLGYIPTPNTIYREIRKFEQGSMMRVSTEKTEKEHWWKIDANIVVPQIISEEQEALMLMDDLLNDSVRRRLVSDVPLGSLLSGGIDSSLVTAIAAKHFGKQMDTFCIKFEYNQYDESIWASKIAQHIGTNHHELTITDKDAMNYLPVMIRQYDEPYGDTSAIPTMIVSKFASEHVTVTLSGDGGDELFHGYGSYLWAERLSKPYIRSLKPFIRAALNMGNNRTKRAAGLFRPNPSQESNIFSQEQSLFSVQELHKILNNQLFDIWKPDYFPLGRKVTPAERQAIFDLSYYLPDDLLVKIDRASMLFSLETRVPLLDHRFVELALNIDPQLKIKDGQGKYLLKKLLNRYVPEKLTDRPKHGFSMPLKEWMRNELKQIFSYYLSPEVVNKYKIFHPQETQKLVTRFYDKNESYLYNRLWLIASLHMWLEQSVFEQKLK